MTTLYTHIESALGQLLLTSRDNKLTGIYFAERPHAKIASDWVRQDDNEVFALTARQLDEYASGERKQFELPTGFNGTPFQIKVWTAIAAIPFGQTITYSDLAQRVDSPNAVRAVGTATGANPLSIVVPCHRVVGKNGTLTGYAGGMPRKSSLLDFEAGKTETLLSEVIQ
jgi:methylated-DNA-[protein]-cysteine S-methyltransferase